MKGQPCKFGDVACPCQDGDPCHFEGENPMTPPTLLTAIPQSAEFSKGDPQKTEPAYSYRDWLAHLEKHGSKCHWCGFRLTPVTATKDHLQPISRFGTDVLPNIVPSCSRCNSLKGNMNAEEFRAWKRAHCGKISTRDTYRNSEIHKDIDREKYDRDLLADLERERQDVSWWRGKR